MRVVPGHGREREKERERERERERLEAFGVLKNPTDKCQHDEECKKGLKVV